MFICLCVCLSVYVCMYECNVHTYIHSRNIGYRDLMICNLCVSNFMSRYSDILYNTVNP